MTVLIIIALSVLVVLSAIAAVLYVRISKRLREQKNYERGLKMIALLIHLPPPSDDTEVGGRDVRDVIEENISKAQVIYNIVASTLQKGGFKTKLYGQRHFAFEIVGTKGFVHFYAAVPITMVEVVKQAIVSAYPSARLEEVPEHNIFNPVGKLTGTVGGELKLKEPFAYPIATYQDLKRDAMQALLNALATLEKEDGAGIQILMRPAENSWRKEALAVASKKRKGADEKKSFSKALLGFGKELAIASIKTVESGKDAKPEKKELSPLEQSVVDSIEDKTRYPGYEVLIRVIVSSNVNQRSQAILKNITAAFSLFDAAGKNGFKYEEAKDIDDFVTSYILRIFPQEKSATILNAVELATIFHFPDESGIPTSQLERQGSKQVDGPRNIPDKGLLLGYNVFRGAKKPIRLGIGDRQRHMYAVGQTGTGKSTFLENLALQDMLDGGGFAFVDPHGDTAERLLAMVPRERTEDVIYFSPSDMEYPMGLNLFEFQTDDQKDFIIQEVLNMLYKLYDPQHQGIMGPRYEHLFRNAALTVMADPEGGTFIDIPKLFRDPQFVKQKLQHVKDQNVLEFWQKEMPQSQRSNEFGEVVSWFVSKFGAFLSNEMMRNIIGQTKSSFDLREIMDSGKILLVNLSKGRLGDLNSKLLGMIFVMKFQAAAMSRANVPEDQRRDFALYVDEFQNFSTDSFATIMSEARKYHLNLIVANQFTTQLTDEIRDAVFGNMGTIVAFRIGQPDVEALSRYFQPTFDGNDLVRVPNHNAIIRTLVGGVPTLPFSMATLPPLGSPNYELAAALKQLSAAKYGRPKAAVEKAIFTRLATIPEPPKPFNSFNKATAASPFGSSGTNQFAAPSPLASSRPQAPAFASHPSGPAAPPAPKPAASFLDEWLTKRKKGSATLPPSPWAKPKAGPKGSQLQHQPPVAPLAPPNLKTQSPTMPAYKPILPPASPTAPHPQPIEGHNISSSSLEKQEVDSIAQELKNELHAAHPASASAASSPAPLAEPLHVPASKSEGEVHIHKPHPAHLAEDTIYIDQDGNMQQRAT